MPTRATRREVRMMRGGEGGYEEDAESHYASAWSLSLGAGSVRRLGYQMGYYKCSW